MGTLVLADTNPARSQEALLSGMDLPLESTLFPLGFTVELCTNRQAVLDAAEESFGHRGPAHGSAGLTVRIGVSEGTDAACPPLPVRRQFDHLYSMVANAENQTLLDLRTGANFVWLTEAAVADPLYFRQNFLEKVVYLLLGATVVTDLHAACVGRQGRGILLCGDSGAGKSTLAYTCARAGWTYTSDDTSYLLNDIASPRVVGHAHRARFRPAARALFPELAHHAVTPRMEGKPSIEVSTADLPVPHTACETDIAAVVYLRRYPGARGRLTPLPRGSGAERLGKELYSAGELRAMHLRRLEKLRPMPTFELCYETLDEGIVQMERLAETL